MAFKKITENVENIATLPDTPALTPLELKKMFDKGNKIIKEYFNGLVDELNENMYPIGTGFIAYDGADYSNYLGFKWEKALIGKTPIGLDPEQTEFNSVGKTGGEKEHKLIVNEMPGHKHNVKDTVYNASFGRSDGGGSGAFSISTAGNTYGRLEATTTGGSQPHNNLQPYEVVNFWKRVS